MARHGGNGWIFGQIKSIREFCCCSTGVRNTREVAGLGDLDPLLAGTAEQTPTRSHPMLTDLNILKGKVLFKKIRDYYKTETGCRLQV